MVYFSLVRTFSELHFFQACIRIEYKCWTSNLSFLETDSGEQLSRKKSLKESIRRSFRRLRSRRGSRGGAERTPSKEGDAPASPAQEAVGSPVSRLVEESRVDESVLSMVRCLYFVDTFVKDGKAC